MGKIIPVIILSCIIFSGCGSVYIVNHNKFDYYSVSEEQGNKLLKNSGEGDCFFNLVKYHYDIDSKNIYSAKIRYTSRDSIIILGITFVNMGASDMLGIKEENGVKVTINNSTSFYLGSMTSPTSKENEHFPSEGGMPTYSRTYTENVECPLTLQQLYALVSAKKIVLNLYGINRDQEWYFSDDNLKNLIRFYKEEIYKK